MTPAGALPTHGPTVTAPRPAISTIPAEPAPKQRHMS